MRTSAHKIAFKAISHIELPPGRSGIGRIFSRAPCKNSSHRFSSPSNVAYPFPAHVSSVLGSGSFLHCICHFLFPSL